MRILALETVTRRGSVAWWDDGAVHALASGDTRTHGARLPGEILTFLASHGRSLGDVDLFAIVSGPGSFTGLRVGMASIQGLALAGGRLVIPIPTLEAMAESWRTSELGIPEPGTQHPGTLVVPCLDGQRGDVFFAGWELSADIPVELSHEIIPASVGKPGDLRRALESVRPEPVAGAAPRRVVLVGDGARRHADTFDGLGVEVSELPGTLAGSAARMAARRHASAVVPHALRPIYIRRPDAELARERAAAGLNLSKGEG